MGNAPPLNPVTTQRGYPLPVGGNYLSDDVVRLGAALASIDGDVAAADTKLLGIKAVSSSYTASAADIRWLLDYTGSSTNDVVTLPLLSAVPRGWNIRVRNSHTQQITLAAPAGATINGTSLFALLPSATIEVATDGAAWKVLSIAQVATGSTVATGTAAAPSYAFANDTSVGVYLPANGQGGLAAGGSSVLVWSAGGILTAGAAGGFKGAGTINAAKVFYAGQDLVARADGTAGAPTYSFASEASLGAYRAGAGVYGIAVGGAAQFTVSAAGLLGAGAAAVAGVQKAGSANLTDLYLNGVSLASSLIFGPSGVAVAGTTGGPKGAGSLNAQDLYLKGASLGNLLGLNGGVGGALNVADVQLNGNSLAGSLLFSTNGVAVQGATGGQKGPGTLNVGALYINGVVLNPGLITPAPTNALGYLRVNAAGSAIEYRSASQVLNDLGVQTALGYIPVNRNGDTMTALVVQGTLNVGAAVSFGSTLTVAGVSSLATLAVLGAASVVGSFGVTGVATLAAASATSLTVGGSLGVSGASTLGALSATSGRFASNLTVSGSSTLAGLSATTASFGGAVSLAGTLGVAGTATVAQLSAGGAAAFAGPATFSAGIALTAGDFAVGSGQRFVSSDATGGFAFQAGTLGSASGATLTLAQYRASVGANQQALRVSLRRATAGADWTSSATRLQMTTDAASQGWVEWSATAGGVGGLRLGAVNTSGLDILMMTLDPANGVVLSTNVSVNNFLGVGGGAQLNGGVSLTGGVAVDTLTGTASWSTSGNITCRYLNQTSDERLKEDFVAVDDETAARFVRDAAPVGYRWRDPEAGRNRHYGYRAQQVRAAGFGDLVHDAPSAGVSGGLSLDYTSTIPLLHVALRRALGEIERLRARLDRLDPAAA